MTLIRAFFPKLGHFFPNSEEWQGRTTSLLPPLVTRLLLTNLYLSKNKYFYNLYYLHLSIFILLKIPLSNFTFLWWSRSAIQKCFEKLTGVLGFNIGYWILDSDIFFVFHFTQQITNLPVSSPGDRIKLLSSLEQFVPSFSILIGIYPAFQLLVFAD